MLLLLKPMEVALKHINMDLTVLKSLALTMMIISTTLLGKDMVKQNPIKRLCR